MADKENIKEKIREIYNVLPKVDDRRCGYDTCGQFARAVAEGRAPCYGCVTGGPEVAAKVCEIMGEKVPEQVAARSGYGSGFYSPGFGGSGGGMGGGMGMGRGGGRGGGRGSGAGRGMGGGMGMGRGMGMGMGGGRGGGAGRGMGMGMGAGIGGAVPPASTTGPSVELDQDVEALRAESHKLLEQISEIRRRIEEMEKED
jgi:hypothetical protein